MIVYLVALLSITFLLNHSHSGRAVALSLSILPAIPLVGVVAIMRLYLKEEKDEFQRSLLLESLLWAAGCLLAVSSVWGLAELYAEIPHIPIFFVFPGFFFFFGICTPLVRFRYHSGPEEGGPEEGGPVE